MRCFTSPGKLLGGMFLALLVVSLCGCPNYENKFSGTFREKNPTARSSVQPLEVDFFRFGEHASAVVRFYEPVAESAYGEQIACVWTNVQEFDEDDNSFTLSIINSTSEIPRGRLQGKITDGGSELKISFFDLETEPKEGEGASIFREIDDIEMERVAKDPDSQCSTIKDHYVEFSFPPDRATGEPQKMPETAGYEFENPVFIVSWLAFSEIEPGRLSQVSSVDPAVRLDTANSSNFEPASGSGDDATRAHLSGTFTVPIPEPPSEMQMSNGDGQIALGHFAVVDDDDSARDISDLSQWEFGGWNLTDEKLIATSLQPGTLPETCPDDTERFGRALLFVKPSLHALDAALLQGDGPSEDIIVGEEFVPHDSGRHFFVVDICAGKDGNTGQFDVQRIIIGERVFSDDVALQVTDEYLDANEIPLPWFNPFTVN